MGEKILDFISYTIIIIVALPVCTFELIFKSVVFIFWCAIFLMMMFMAPLFKNFSWPKPIVRFLDYVFSLNFTLTYKIISSYKSALNIR